MADVGDQGAKVPAEGPAVNATTTDGQRFLQVMKRYCIDYVNVGDQSVTRDIMVEDYLLRMGHYEVRGRDTAYFDATAALLKQFPKLMLTVHEIATDGDRLMMRFTEHARRARDGAICAWGGIGLYRWNGDCLVQCNVEQDYMSRKRQIEAGTTDPIDAPTAAPWTGDPEQADPAAAALVAAWLERGELETTPQVHCDEGWTGAATPRLIDQQRIEILDLFAVGKRVGFHALQHGAMASDLIPGASGRSADLHAIGIVHVEGGQISGGRVIRNRLDLAKRLEAERA